jgi:hypothetical protein
MRSRQLALLGKLLEDLQEGEDDMILNWNKLPLFDAWDYDFSVDLEDESYTFRIYYSERTEKWSVDISLEDGEVLVEGEAILPYKMGVLNKIPSLSGFLWLEAISQNDNETLNHPDRIDKYYNFYYIYPSEGVVASL